MAKKSSFPRLSIISFLAVAAFGLIAIAMTYQALIAPTRTEPKAAEATTLFKRWEFNGSTPEGWTGNGTTLSVKNGSLVITVNRDFSSNVTLSGESSQGAADIQAFMPGSVSVSNDNVATTMPRGIKYFTLRLAASGNWINPVSAEKAVTSVKDGVISDSEEVNPDVQGVSTSTDPVEVEITKLEASCDPIYTCDFRKERVCRLLARVPGWCRPRPSIMPRPTCIPRPPCLDTEPACLLPESKNYCPPGVTPRGKTIILGLVYSVKGKNGLGRPLIIKAVADGQFHEYKVRFPDVEAIDLNTLRLHLFGAARYSDLKVDWMRLSGSPVSIPSLIPTPRVTCMPRPKCLDADPPCSVPPLLENQSWCKPTAYPKPPKGCKYVYVQCIKAPCDPVLVCPTPTSSTEPVTECVRAGCSGQLCVKAGGPPINTTCEYSPRYGCYNNADCEVQKSGACGWTMTDELKSCLDTATE